MPGCDARWVCATEDDVLVNVAAHAAEVHGVTEVRPELVAAVRSAIVTTA